MNVAILTIGLVFLMNSTSAIQEKSAIKIYKDCHEDSKSFDLSLDLERSTRSTTQNFSEWLPTILNVIALGGPELLKACLLALITFPCFEPFNTIFNFIGGPKCIINVILEAFFEGLFKLLK